MKKYLTCALLVLMGTYLSYAQTAQQNGELKIVFIRHGEKPEKGGNLTCKGLNRSLMLPALIKQKFGIPNYIYVPALKLAEKTGHARMFETVIPLASQYNIDIDSKYEETDSAGIATDIMKKQGIVLVAWEHNALRGILHSLGVEYNTKWPGDDYDTILVVTFPNGKATLTRDSEGLKPSDNCPN